MSESQEHLIQETNIIPVINVDNASPLAERSDFTIDFDNFRSFKHIHKTKNDDASDKSSFLEASHKVFEKLSGSLTAISKSIRSSLELVSTREEESTQSISSSFEYDIDVVGTSPCNKYIATWSSEDGILAVFPIDQYGPKACIFEIKTPFNKENVPPENNTRIYISVSEDGQYVAISRIPIIKENQKDTPNMDVYVNLDGSERVQSSLVVYSINNNTKKDDSISKILNSLEILGPLIFVHHHTLVFFTKTNMHLFSTKHWALQNSVQIDALIHSSPNYSDNSNEFLVKIYDILFESLKHGYLIWPEEKSGLSLWDLNGMLKQWFYIEARNMSHTRNLFDVSSKGDLVARFYENKKGGKLCIFHTSTALKVSEVQAPKNTFLISFLHKTDQIILCSQEEESVCVQLWDCWAGLLVFEEKWTYLKHDKPLLFLGDKFLQAVGNELCTYPLFPNNSTVVIVEALTKTQNGCKTGETGENELVIKPSLGKQQGITICWGNIYDKENVLLCKFKFEPWHDWNNCELFLHWLDSEGKRFIMVGKDSVQIYKTKSKGKYLTVDLQYIWMTKTDEEIKLVTLETREETDIEQIILHVQLTNNDSITLPLPEENDKITYRIMTDACTVIHYLRLQYTSDMQFFNRLLIREQLKKLIDSSVQLFPSTFNKISLGDNEYFYPMEDFILLGWDDLVECILETDRYIPLFHNEEQTESALYLLVELQKSELVEKMVNYMIKHLKQRHYPVRNSSVPTNISDYMTKKVIQQPGFFWTLSKNLLDLYKYYPDKGILVMKESSYFTTSLEAPISILQTRLGNPFEGEERTCYDELKAVTRRSRLPRGGTQEVVAKKREVYESILSKYFTSSSRTRQDTGALIYYPEGTNYSVKKQDMKEIHGIRQRQRRERLEDAKKTHPAKLCVVPWPDFCVYPPTEDTKSSSLFQKVAQFWNLYISPSHRSPFAEVALNGTSEMFSEVAMEAIVKAKWNKYARRLFLYNFIFYITHAILFCTIISIDSDLVPPEGESSGWKVPVFILESFIPMILLLQELRQMFGRWQNYWTSFFNYADLASFCLPLACSLMVVAKSEPPPGLKSFAVLCVWLNALLQSRAFEGPGKFIAIVIEIGKKMLLILITLFVIVLGFSNALFVLLRDISPIDIVQAYNGTITDQNTGQQIANITMNQTPQDDTNMWQRFDYSILATYFFLGVGWDSVTTIGPNVPLYIMIVLFNFVAVIMLLNILIGLITDVFSGSLQVGRQAWLRQRSELIAELELFMLMPSQRQHPDWFPHLVYYEAHVDSIKNWRRKLDMDEVDELDTDFVRKELKIVKDDLTDELKEVKGMVGQIRIFMKNSDGAESK